ncbi:unnamed protein product [Adineta ricciae]|uniref:NAD(P)(+)--arginine ADP-ribosyltransferase n=1 Tax=Adineta ricciae TaxID=249248 RepID=A0A815Z0D3_ADIRI|nr:unnamed protein product [Adineta ricciae]
MDEPALIPSPFYYACKKNNFDLVEQLLREHTLEELDRMEPNDSTPLHVACFHNSIGVVVLLLQRGFTRRMLNKYDKTPYEEISNENKHLFHRDFSTHRFGGKISLEEELPIWVRPDVNLKNIPADYLQGNRLKYGALHIDRICTQLRPMINLDVIRRFLRQAVEGKDCIYLIQAYTAETDFYKRVNHYLLSRNEDNPLLEFVQTIYFNRELHETYSYKDYCYRSVCLNALDDLNVFKKGSKISNRTFLCTTQERTIAEEYIRKCNTADQHVVMMIFRIRHSYTALDVQHISEFPHEKEILIMFDSVFEVTDIIQNDNANSEIHLTEIKPTYRFINK